MAHNFSGRIRLLGSSQIFSAVRKPSAVCVRYFSAFIVITTMARWFSYNRQYGGGGGGRRRKWISAKARIRYIIFLSRWQHQHRSASSSPVPSQTKAGPAFFPVFPREDRFPFRPHHHQPFSVWIEPKSLFFEVRVWGGNLPVINTLKWFSLSINASVRQTIQYVDWQSCLVFEWVFEKKSILEEKILFF